jgi:VCBS repeat-containing protein
LECLEGRQLLAASALSSVTAAALFNQVPVALDDSYVTGEDHTLSPLAINGVLRNDADADGDALAALLVAGPANGSLTLAIDGSFIYEPDPDFYGIDSFIYQADDGSSGSNPATVTIAVYPRNDRLVITSNGGGQHAMAHVAENTTFVTTVTATDSDGTGLLYFVLGPDRAHFTIDAASGVLTFVTPPDYEAPVDHGRNNVYDIMVLVVGAGGADIQQLSIFVTDLNEAPSAVSDVYGLFEDSVLDVPAPGLLANDSDSDGSFVTAVLVAGPTHGSLTFHGDGSFVYVPHADFYGADSFTYLLSDGGANSNVATVSLHVTAVNDAPLANQDSYSVPHNATLTVAAGGVLANDHDVDGDLLTAVLLSGPGHGTLALHADGSFSYVPSAGFGGVDSFTYQASDGRAASLPTTVTITIGANRAPVALDDSYAVPEDGTLSVAAAGVLVNDSDADNDPLQAVLVAGPAHGSLTLGADGSFTYTPRANFNGADSFTYSVSDGIAGSNLATVRITVVAVDDAPVARDDTYTMAEDGRLDVAARGVLANDRDVDGDAVSAILVAGPAHGTLTFAADGSFSYAPAANFHGVDSFTYRAGGGNTATVTITVAAINDVPSAADEAYTLDEDQTLHVPVPGMLNNAADIDGDLLTANLVSAPRHGTLTLNADGSITYTPDANWHGVDHFTYTVSDGSADSNLATVTLTVNPTNDEPVAEADSYRVAAGQELAVGVAGVLGNDGDVDGDRLTVTLASGPSHGALVLNADGSFTYTPAAGFSGIDQFTYQVSDGVSVSAATTVTISVSAADEPPVVDDDEEPTPAPPASPPVEDVVPPIAVEPTPTPDEVAPLPPAEPQPPEAGPDAGPPEGSTGPVAGPASGVETAAGEAEAIVPPAGGEVPPESVEPPLPPPPAPAPVSVPTVGDAAPPVLRLQPQVPLRPSAPRFSPAAVLGQLDAQPAAEAGHGAIDAALKMGFVASAGYVLLSTRASYWFLSAVAARPLWKQFDPLEVLFAWEEEQARLDREGEPQDDESLQSMIAGGQSAAPGRALCCE